MTRKERAAIDRYVRALHRMTEFIRQRDTEQAAKIDGLVRAILNNRGVPFVTILDAIDGVIQREVVAWYEQRAEFLS